MIFKSLEKNSFQKKKKIKMLLEKTKSKGFDKKKKLSWLGKKKKLQIQRSKIEFSSDKPKNIPNAKSKVGFKKL